MKRTCAVATIVGAAVTVMLISIPAARAIPVSVPALTESAKIEKAVTAAGVAHRSSRRTARRVYRRHHY
jgi:hypothetical protein